MSAEAILHVPVTSIIAGANPRKFFPVAEQKELEDSIRMQGLLQFPLVRPVENEKYEIVAGERRVRAYRSVYGEQASIPVFVREMSDAQAEVAAITENIQREGMSPTEEAEAAHRVLNRLRDRSEVAAELGWPMSKLDRRLALMRLTPEARDALTERKISLGHAELIAALEPSKQLAAVTRVIEKRATVAELRASLARLASDLSVAIFDKSECAGCQYNSEQQAALFAESIGEGSCTQPSCYAEKTDNELKAKQAQLQREVAKVEFVQPGDDKLITIKIVPEGRTGVGAEQFAMCKSCENYGATISRLPENLGEVDRDICFNAKCHTKNMHAFATASQAAASEAVSKAASVGSGGTTKVVVNKVASPAPAVGQVRQAIKDYAEAYLRKLAVRAVVRNDDMAQKLLIWMASRSMLRFVQASVVNEALVKATGAAGKPNASDFVQQLAPVQDKLTRMISVVAASAFKDPCFMLSEVKEVLNLLGVKLEQEWVADEHFMEILNKNEIEAFALSSGLSEHLGQEAMKKLLNQKKPDVIKSFLSHGDFLKGKLHPALSLS